ncbi:DUF4328 domain-containing protein [Streptomyces sp. NPDC048623]|uniref:DUF4328 domain-containing protein n=1 Tax=Streptomyces sp. NPDC048623 TaxID=3155761 RepID=UPI003429CCE0
MLRNPKGLSYAVVALLAVNIVFDVLLGLLEVGTLTADDPLLSGNSLLGAPGVSVVVSLSLLVFTATVVVFIVWFHRLRQNAQVWAGDLQSRGSGWAIGGWFVPIGNLWIPRNIAAEIWRASRMAPYAADGPGELALLNGWWAAFAVSMLMHWSTSQMFLRAETVDALLSATWWSLATYVVKAVAAVLAILFVRRLTSMQHLKANGMIPAAQ